MIVQKDRAPHFLPGALSALLHPQCGLPPSSTGHLDSEILFFVLVSPVWFRECISQCPSRDTLKDNLSEPEKSSWWEIKDVQGVDQSSLNASFEFLQNFIVQLWIL